ncbi:MAG: hypothetical protein HY600_05045, partial [Candidatus Omnitrophica bacterium]|nr:hypothetical protein [Candidatus Omnitrophota bacterium]
MMRTHRWITGGLVVSLMAWASPALAADAEAQEHVAPEAMETMVKELQASGLSAAEAREITNQATREVVGEREGTGTERAGGVLEGTNRDPLASRQQTQQQGQTQGQTQEQGRQQTEQQPGGAPGNQGGTGGGASERGMERGQGERSQGGFGGGASERGMERGQGERSQGGFGGGASERGMERGQGEWSQGGFE